MEILTASFENYRNLRETHLDLGGLPTFLNGANGQGKSNLLEGIGLITAFRSFRTSELKHLIHLEANLARLCLTVRMDQGRILQIDLVTDRSNGRGMSVEGVQLPTLQDFIGRFPTITFSEDDIQILRGAPSLRRRAIDLFYSSLDPGYLDALRRYHLALKDRNAQLRHRPLTPLLRPFEIEMARHGSLILQLRRQYTARFAAAFKLRYSSISKKPEESSDFSHLPSIDAEDEDSFFRNLDEGRDRDIQLQTTRHGPHRDDFNFELMQMQAKNFASDGQQRNLVLAFRLAQLDLLEAQRKEKPVILADDILGSLDPTRRSAFWEAVGPERQVIATGTHLPEDSTLTWNLFQITNGTATKIPT
ncbi:MAG: DNA replication/repair protein RecF [Puniceicoccaceae bacterium]